jgi:hypothetical protein
MSDVVECFLVRPSSRARRGLRRYVSSLNAPTVPPCTGRGYHDAIAWIDELHVVHGRDGVSRLEASGADQVEAFAGDPRWPAACAYCTDYAFLENDERQIFWEVVWERADDPRVTMTLREPLPGAMYYADWYGRGEAWSCGPDGRALIVVTPDRHPWHIDGTASNDLPLRREAAATRRRRGAHDLAGAGMIDSDDYAVPPDLERRRSSSAATSRRCSRIGCSRSPGISGSRTRSRAGWSAMTDIVVGEGLGFEAEIRSSSRPA